MAFKLLDVVVAAVDFPENGIRVGDVGTIVEVYPDGEFEIEFADGNGETTAMFAVTSSQIAPANLRQAA